MADKKGPDTRVNLRALEKSVAKGKTDIKYLRKEYTRMRDIAQKRIKRIEKSAIPFTAGHRPAFSTLKEYGKVGKDFKEEYFLRAYVVLSRFIIDPTSTAEGRARQRDNSIETLRKHGIDFVNTENYMQWVVFISWFTDSGYALIYDSDEQTVEDIFKMAPNAGPEEWERLFKEYTEQNRRYS